MVDNKVVIKINYQAKDKPQQGKCPSKIGDKMAYSTNSARYILTYYFYNPTYFYTGKSSMQFFMLLK